jgi:hypothetical protein
MPSALITKAETDGALASLKSRMRERWAGNNYLATDLSVGSVTDITVRIERSKKESQS